MKKLQFFACVCLAMLLLGGTPSREAQAALYISEHESLQDIADNTGAELELLAAMNNLPADQLLQAGTLLRLPEQPLQSITVAAGDTIYSLARSYGVDAAELMAENNIRSNARIWPGQTLYLPLAEEQSVFLGQPVVPVFALASRQAAANYAWPVDGFISSPFGQRESGYHWGLDIAADHGSDVLAALAGTVSEAGWKNDAYGYAVMLLHADGTETLYAHCSEVLVEAGQSVRRGDAIARVGSTGNSSGPHVHFEVRQGGNCVNPMDYLP